MIQELNNESPNDFIDKEIGRRNDRSQSLVFPSSITIIILANRIDITAILLSHGLN